MTTLAPSPRSAARPTIQTGGRPVFTNLRGVKANNYLIIEESVSLNPRGSKKQHKPKTEQDITESPAKICRTLTAV